MVCENGGSPVPSALSVIKSFWEEHPEYRHKHPPRVYSGLLVQHLALVDAAAFAAGRRGAALAYLLKSLGQEPGRGTFWKWLVKTLLPGGLGGSEVPGGNTETT